MIAYMAVSSKAEPTPWAIRIVRHHTANGQPSGTRAANAKSMVDTEAMHRPQRYTQTLPRRSINLPATGENTKMMPAKMANVKPTMSSDMPFALACGG